MFVRAVALLVDFDVSLIAPDWPAFADMLDAAFCVPPPEAVWAFNAWFCA
jgi:hypothetical protein